jgi:hypothetical protein
MVIKIFAMMLFLNFNNDFKFYCNARQPCQLIEILSFLGFVSILPYAIACAALKCESCLVFWNSIQRIGQLIILYCCFVWLRSSSLFIWM